MIVVLMETQWQWVELLLQVNNDFNSCIAKAASEMRQLFLCQCCRPMCIMESEVECRGGRRQPDYRYFL